MSRPRRIVIVGFMGCGKSTVAKALARRLDCDMIDLDTYITEQENRSPAELIAQDGEAAFRALETGALRNILKQRDWRVIALGGGAWTIAANRALIRKSNCLTVWLNAPFELCWQRIISKGKSARPLAPNRKRALALFTSRKPKYRSTDLHISADGKRAALLASEIEGYLS